MRPISIIIILFCSSAFAFSQQKNIEIRDQIWLGYFNQTRFTNKSGLWLDLHLRLTDHYVNQLSVGLIRAGYTYYLSDQVRLTAGYAYITHYGSPGTPNVPEHRPWQQIQWFDKKERFSLMQWFRIEERYRAQVLANELTNDYNFNWRFRYNFALTLPLKGKIITSKTPFLFFNDEIHINAGKSIINNYFDQNRLFLGIGYQFTPNLNAHLGYMNVFQQLPAGNKFINTNAIRLFIFHNLDFRNKD